MALLCNHLLRFEFVEKIGVLLENYFTNARTPVSFGYP